MGLEAPSVRPYKEEWKRAVHDGFIEKYGTHPMKLPEFSQKVSETSHIWLKRREETCMERFGTTNFFLQTSLKNG